MSDRYEVKISDQALEQLERTVDYISHTLAEPQTAYKWLNSMEQEMQSLEFMPNRVRLTYEEPWRSRGIHCMNAMNYNVYFRIEEESKTVWVTAVIYGRRNQCEQLRNMNTDT